MPIAYYAQHAGREHWSRVWEQEQLEELLAIASRDPLSRHLTTHLGTSGTILEAGCGLGQYVLLLGQHGYDVIGGDHSLEALQTHRDACAESSLVGLDLGRLPLADGSIKAQISLGVVEHVAAGPQELLRESYRTLEPSGRLLIGVPWVNGSRRFAAPLIRQRQSALREAGAQFYQYAYTFSEIRGFLQDAGFEVEAFRPYSPARGVRETPLLRWALRRIRTTAGARGPNAGAEWGRQLGTVSGLRRILYWPPVLWTFAHMILAVARKPVS